MAKSTTKKRSGAILRFILLIIFLVIFVFSICQLYGVWLDQQAAAAVQEELLLYKPETRPAATTLAAPADAPTPEPTANDLLLQLQEKYPDVCGWLELDGTNIDYCFAQGSDNAQYLHSSPNGEYLAAGTLFLDHRCSRQLSNVNYLIYGHNMKDGSMFGELAKYADAAFFSDNSSGTLYLPQETCGLEIFAYLVVPETDSVIYDPAVSQAEFLAHLQTNAQQYRELELKDSDVFLTLSTCNYAYDGARSVVIARIVR